MPPKTGDDVLLTDDDHGRSLTDSPSSMSAMRDKEMPVVPATAKLCYPSLRMERNFDYESLAVGLAELEVHVEDLLREVNGMTTNSPVIAACRFSLRCRMPLMLRQVSQLISALKNNDNGSDHRVDGLRGSFGLARANQYLSILESAVDLGLDGELDDILKVIMDTVKQQELTEQFKQELCFRISIWAASKLIFDLPIGEPIRLSVEPSKGKLPLTLEVEPIAEFSKADLLNGRVSVESLLACKVQVETCKHRALKFAAGAGNVGEAMISIQVSPLDIRKRKDLAWSEENELPKLVVKGALAMQLNAFPPKPKANVDLYTSCEFGDPCVTVTLIVKTCATANDEPPHLHIELFIGC